MNLRKPDIGYIPTSPQIVESMLSLAKLTSQDILYDLGSGDGRILITAAQKYGTKGVGIDIDPQRIQQGQ
ncbi:MAG: SAM-dependent methyltransferase, partial [Spirulinaceae cyanobacterium]